MERRMLAVQDGQVSYLMGGQNLPTAPLVFVHGLTIDARTWVPIARKLGQRRWFALDLPGHGASEWCDDYSYQRDAEVLIALITQLGEPSLAVGHSRGAQVCLLAASMRPDLFLAMYLEDLTPRFWWEAPERGLAFAASVFRLRGIAETAREQNQDATWIASQIGRLRHDSSTTFAQRLTRSELRVWAESIMSFDPDVLGRKGNFGPPQQSAADILASIAGPVHLAHGEPAHGSAVTEEELTWFHAEARQGSSTAFLGLGHFLHGARPTEFAKDLCAFLERTQLLTPPVSRSSTRGRPGTRYRAAHPPRS
ncbi:MAG: alpha/beta fold hydrolase [Dehalococcoidia bacterium]